MPRRWVAGLVVAVLLLGSSGASADPTNWAQLVQIIAWLQKIDSTMQSINGLVADIRNKFAMVYPDGSLRRIETLFEPVDSIKDEVEKLACNWRFTPRVEKLRLSLFGNRSFCQSDWNLLFGPPVPTVDWDLESYYDWSADRRLNLIKTRNQKSERRALEAAFSRTRRSRAGMPGIQPSHTRPATRNVCLRWARPNSATSWSRWATRRPPCWSSTRRRSTTSAGAGCSTIRARR